MKSSYQYRKRDYGFGNLCLTLRTAIGVTQGELAHLLGVTERTIQTWEGGSSYPKIDRNTVQIRRTMSRKVVSLSKRGG